MRKLLSGAALALCLLLPSYSEAAQVLLPDNPTSVTGNFALTPGAGAFEDQVIFEVTGAPAYVVIGNATNTFAAPADRIQNWVASIFNDGVDNIINNADDELLFGPQAATPCIGVANCQSVGGSGVVLGSGFYYVEFTGIGSGTSGYAGNVSTFAVPGPAAGAGIPGLIAACVGLVALVRRRRARQCA